MKDNYSLMAKNSPNKSRSRKDPVARREHFMSIWLEDASLKRKLTALAKTEGRTTNNFFNRSIAPIIHGALAERFEALPEEVKRRVLNG